MIPQLFLSLQILPLTSSLIVVLFYRHTERERRRHTHTHTHTHTHNLLSPLTVAHMHMCLGLTTRDWMTIKGFIPEHGQFFLSQ